MTDVVVTVPSKLWSTWLEEGDLARWDDWVLPRDKEWAIMPATWGGVHEYGFTVRHKPDIAPGERVYIVAKGLLRGYAPLVRIGSAAEFGGQPDRYALVRRGDAVAVSIPQIIVGFRNYRYRWWNRADERPFRKWRTTVYGR